jgi:di/tricarboxylate transporter
VTEAAEGAAGSPRSPHTLWLGRVLGPAFLVGTLVLPPPGDLGPDAWRVAGLALFMATWWVTEVIPIPVTALLPLPLLPLLQISSVEAAAAPFSPPDVQDRSEYVDTASANVDAMLGLVYAMLALAQKGIAELIEHQRAALAGER